MCLFSYLSKPKTLESIKKLYKLQRSCHTSYILKKICNQTNLSEEYLQIPKKIHSQTNLSEKYLQIPNKFYSQTNLSEEYLQIPKKIHSQTNLSEGYIQVPELRSINSKDLSSDKCFPELFRVPLYFKITKEPEIHNGYKYKTGLNELSSSMDVQNCNSGFYFATSNYIHRFYHHGVNLRIVALPTWKSNFIIIQESFEVYRVNKIILGPKFSLDDWSIYVKFNLQYPTLHYCKYRNFKIQKYLQGRS